jgi:hypothetical protein
MPAARAGSAAAARTTGAAARTGDNPAAALRVAGRNLARRMLPVTLDALDGGVCIFKRAQGLEVLATV